MSWRKIQWMFKRHPFLYLVRFRLLSKNANIETIADYSYNNHNSKDEIPECFYEINSRIFESYKPKTDLDKVKCLSLWLHKHIKKGPGLSVSSDVALKIMLEGKGGVCSDMVQIFNNFCVINDIKVREWGATLAPFSKNYGGHSFNEVYCKELSKWVLIDPYWGILFFNKLKLPLSVIETYKIIRENISEINYVVIDKNEVLQKENVYKNYLNPDIAPFLICGYHNKTYDKFLKVTRPYLPVFITHFTVFLLNKSYSYKFPLDNYKNIFIKH